MKTQPRNTNSLRGGVSVCMAPGPYMLRMARLLVVTAGSLSVPGLVSVPVFTLTPYKVAHFE